jgi:hypothetical protein
MRKIFNFLVLLDLIKSNDIKEDNKFYNSKLRCICFIYYFDEKVFNSKIFFCETIRKDCSIHYEVIEGKFKFNLWNWQAKLLYKMAKNKYLKNDILF